MPFGRVGVAALAAAVAAIVPSVRAQDTTATNHSTFVNTDAAIGFAFGVPEDAQDQFYFTLRVHRSHAWGGVGLGSEHMAGALYLMVYDNHEQDNITFSPRVTYGHYEPAYYSAMEYELLNGTGIYDQHMIVKGRCLSNCLSWPAHGTGGGKIDVHSDSEKGVYALGPLAGFASDYLDESLQYHVQYGTFSMNMTRTHGATQPPDIEESSESDGATLGRRYIRKADVVATVHAVFMIGAIVLLMPLGAAMLRLGQWVRWHAITQSLAMAFVLVGFGFGIAASLRYQRSRGFNSYHQILGIFVTIFVLVQFGLGYFNHRVHRRTQRHTKYNRIHLWLGRFIIFLGIMNGFFGFTFAMDRRYGIVLAALVIAMCFAIFVTIIGRRWLTKRARRNNVMRRGAEISTSHRHPVTVPHDPASWQGMAAHPEYAYRPRWDGPELAPQYQPPPQNVGLRRVASPPGWEDPQAHSQRLQNPGGDGLQAPREPRELL